VELPPPPPPLIPQIPAVTSRQPRAAAAPAAKSDGIRPAAKAAATPARVKARIVSPTAQSAPVALPNLEPLQFESGQSVLTAANREMLKRHTQKLLAVPGAQVVVEGHSDSTGTSEANLTLAAQRAELVANYMVSVGLPIQRISAISYGEERPLDPANTPAARAKNRRVQFLVYRAPDAASDGSDDGAPNPPSP